MRVSGAKIPVNVTPQWLQWLLREFHFAKSVLIYSCPNSDNEFWSCTGSPVRMVLDEKINIEYVPAYIECWFQLLSQASSLKVKPVSEHIENLQLRQQLNRGLTQNFQIIICCSVELKTYMLTYIPTEFPKVCVCYNAAGVWSGETSILSNAVSLVIPFLNIWGHHCAHMKKTLVSCGEVHFNSCDEAPFTSILSGPLSSKTIDNYHTIWIGGMVLFCTFMKPSMDKSRESCNNPLW